MNHAVIGLLHFKIIDHVHKTAHVTENWIGVITKYSEVSANNGL